MIQSVNGQYTLSEELVDSILIHQKDRLIKWLNEMETTTNPTFFSTRYNQVMGAVVVLADLWAAFGYSYKAEELTVRIKRMKTTHRFKELMT